MPVPSEFQSRRGTVAVTFTQTGTYSSIIDLAGLRLVGAFSPAWPGAAGSVTFRSSLDPSGTGYPVTTEGQVLYRLNPFGSATFYALTPGSAPIAAQYLRLEVGTGGTAGVAGGGTIVLIGAAW